MIIRAFILMLLVSGITLNGIAAETRVSPDYLEGKWVLGGKQECGSGVAEYLLMRVNGTFEMGKAGTANVTGFWELNNDTLTLHMLVSPATATDQNPFYRGSYRYQYITAKVLDTKQDAFEVIVGTNIDSGVQKLVRCP